MSSSREWSTLGSRTGEAGAGGEGGVGVPRYESQREEEEEAEEERRQQQEERQRRQEEQQQETHEDTGQQHPTHPLWTSAGRWASFC
jgi:hypothetical protein